MAVCSSMLVPTGRRTVRLSQAPRPSLWLPRPQDRVTSILCHEPAGDELKSMQFPTGIRSGAVVPGHCAVTGCDNPEILPENGLCLVHNCLLGDFQRWLDTGIDADSWVLWRWSGDRGH